jgi:hypothetical protein
VAQSQDDDCGQTAMLVVRAGMAARSRGKRAQIA